MLGLGPWSKWFFTFQMPPKKKPKYEYSHEQLELALEALKKGDNAFSVSKRFGVPRSTLIYKATGKSPINKDRKLGPAPRIGIEAEQMLKKWAMALATRGFPITKNDLLTSVHHVLKDLKSEHLFPGGRPGPTWLTLFLKRNPEISQRTVEKLSKVRADVSENFIKAWFNEIEKYVRENNLLPALSDPSRVFNMDETAFFLCPQGQKVLAIRGQKNVYEVHSGSDKESLTVLANINAKGDVAPTLVVLPGQRLPPADKVKLPSGWAMAKSESGWINGEVFYEYFVNYFYPWLIEKQTTFPVVVFLDGHKSHLTYHLSSFCAEHEIVLIALPANCTHIMQPLDVAVFRSLKRGWADLVHDWRMKNGGERLTKYNFSPMLKEVFNIFMKESTIVNGFRRCGLSPLDRNAVDYSKVEICHKEIETATTSKSIPVNQKAVGQDTATSNHPIGQGCMEFMESFILPETLKKFQTTYSDFTPIWKGDESCHDLYVMWKKAKDWASDNSSKSKTLNACLQVDPSTSRAQLLEEPSTSRVLPPEETMTSSSSAQLKEDLLKTPGKDVSKLAKVLSPETNGENVPSPFKKNLFWPGTPTKTKRKTRTPKEKLPSVVSSKEWLEYEKNKKDKKKKEEEQKAERKRQREAKQIEKTSKKKSNKKFIYDLDEDWTCKVCGGRYSAEIIIGGTSSRRWIECDDCKKTFHYKCIPKQHLNIYGLDEDSDNEDEMAFVCHECSPDTDDDLNCLLASEDDESE